MRTIQEIKNSITTDFMGNEDVARIYGFAPGSSFASQFSKVSIESIYFYIFACICWVQENIFAEHKKEVQFIIDEYVPHRPKWYRDKVLGFMKGKLLIPDTDKYDTSDMNDSDIHEAKVVKHAVAIENADASILTIKVAGESGGVRNPLDEETVQQLSVYIGEFKDAGVRINLVNLEADIFSCEVDIYYDALLIKDTIEISCREVIKQYVENLPFNGEYTNMALVNYLQEVDGVKVVEFKEATTKSVEESTYSKVNARYVPAAGYFHLETLALNMIAYE